MLLPQNKTLRSALLATTLFIYPFISASLSEAHAQTVIGLVKQAEAKLKHTHYVFGGNHFDLAKGNYLVDCSGYTDYLLKEKAPTAYAELISYTKAPRPNTTSYFNFIQHVRETNSSNWQVVHKAQNLRAGDFLVFKQKNPKSHKPGHIMVITKAAQSFRQRKNTYLIRVSDSTPHHHSADTRAKHQTGIGEGDMLLKVDPKTGQPTAYAWTVRARLEQHMSMAMVRLV